MSVSTTSDSKDVSVRQKAIEKLLEQERKFYDRKCKEYVQNPSVRIKESLGESEKRTQQLEEERSKLIKVGSASNSAAQGSREANDRAHGGGARKGQSMNSVGQMEHDGRANEKRDSLRSGLGGSSTQETKPPVRQDVAPLTEDKKSKLARIIVDDEDVDEDVAEDNATGPFASLDNLSMKPAHMAVFMQYLVNDGSSASDPAPLFFFLLTGIFQRQSVSSRELRRMARDVAQTFLAGPGKAPLQVDIKSSIVEKIQETLEDRNSSDDTIRTLFVQARFEVAKRVGVQLSSFREMRAIGLATMFGEFQLQDNMTRTMELDIVQKVLTPTLNELSGGEGSSKGDTSAFSRNAALQMSILTVMEDIGITGSHLRAKKVDRMVSLSGSKGATRSLFSRNKSKRQIHMIAGHSFVAKHYNSLTFCDHCHGLLWGLGHQGYNCLNCGFNVHKVSCNSELTFQCPGTAVERGSFSLIGSKESNISLSVSPSPSTMSTKGAPDTHSVTSEVTELPQPETGSVSSKLKDFETRFHPDVEPRRGGSLRPRGSHLSLSAGARDFGEERRAGTSIQRAQSLKLTSERPMRFKHRSIEEGSFSDHSSISPSSARSSSLHDVRATDGDGTSIGSNDFDEHQALTDPDMEVDEELTPWSSLVDKKFMKVLGKKEVKRQDLINELIHTEKTHIRKLKVMLYIFYRPLLSSQLLDKDKTQSLFPHLEELISIHCNLLAQLKERSNPQAHGSVSFISEAISNVFGGDQGEVLKNAAAEWVKLRQENLENLKHLRNKNQRFSQFIQVS